MLISLSPTQLAFIEKSEIKEVHHGKQKIWSIKKSEYSQNNSEYSLTVLDEVFNGSKDRSALDLTLANQYVRYLVLPSMPTQNKKAVIEQYAKHAFIETFGEIASDWQIMINPFNHGKSVIACATPSILVNEILVKCGKLNITVNSIQPYLMSGFNLLRKKKNQSHVCFIQAEAEGYLIALLVDETWISVNFFKQSINDEPLLIQTIKREMLIANWEDQPVSLFSMGFSNSIKFNQANWRHERVMPKHLNNRTEVIDVAVLMALSGEQ
jgi:hypothetical protein